MNHRFFRDGVAVLPSHEPTLCLFFGLFLTFFSFTLSLPPGFSRHYGSPVLDTIYTANDLVTRFVQLSSCFVGSFAFNLVFSFIPLRWFYPRWATTRFGWPKNYG